jgi:outer membrane protein TolC
MNGKDMIMPMVKVTLPIYRKKYKAMQKEAELLKSASNYNYNNTANSLSTEFYSAMETYLDAQRRLALYKKQLTLSRKSLDIMIRSFSATGAGLTDILRVRQQNIDYDLKLVQALTDYNSSIAYIKRLMSTMDVK